MGFAAAPLLNRERAGDKKQTASIQQNRLLGAFNPVPKANTVVNDQFLLTEGVTKMEVLLWCDSEQVLGGEGQRMV